MVGDIVTRGDLPHWFMPGAVHFVTYRLYGTIPAEVLNRIRAERDVRIAAIRSRPVSGKAASDLNQDELRKVHQQFFAAYDRYLDRNNTASLLTKPGVTEVIVENLLHHHESKYQLFEYTVMPNHVHVLLLPLEKHVGDAASVGNEKIRTQDAGSIYHVGDAASVGNPGKRTIKAVRISDHCSGECNDATSPLSSIMHSLKSYTANCINRILNQKGCFWQRESYDHWIRDERELRNTAEYIAMNSVTAKLAKTPSEWLGSSAWLRRNQPGRLLEWW